MEFVVHSSRRIPKNRIIKLAFHDTGVHVQSVPTYSVIEYISGRPASPVMVNQFCVTRSHATECLHIIARIDFTLTVYPIFVVSTTVVNVVGDFSLILRFDFIILF